MWTHRGGIGQWKGERVYCEMGGSKNLKITFLAGFRTWMMSDYSGKLFYGERLSMIMNDRNHTSDSTIYMIVAECKHVTKHHKCSVRKPYHESQLRHSFEQCNERQRVEQRQR